MPNQIFTKDFTETVYNLLKDYDSKEFNLMISGGSLLNHLTDQRYSKLNTTKWKVFFADERCNKEFLNFKDAKGFLDQVKGEIYKIEILDNLEEGMRKYKETLELKAQRIDLCLLGVGNNGHICSLWPKSPNLDTKELVELVSVDCPFSPKRITTTLFFLNSRVSNLFFIIPDKDGVPKKVKEPHPNIKSRIKKPYTIVLPAIK